MKIDCNRGGALAARLSSRGSTLIEQSGVLFMAAFHGVSLPLDGYELNIAEEAAQDVLDAIKAYRKATAEPPAPLVPRPEHGRTYRETMPQRDYGDECDSSEAS